MKTRKTQLKIKIKSLASEAKIIKHEERRVLDRAAVLRAKQGYEAAAAAAHDLYWNLHQHRIFEVRREARAALIAYGFIRGRDFKRVDRWKSHDESVADHTGRWKRVTQLVASFAQIGEAEAEALVWDWTREASAEALAAE